MIVVPQSLPQRKVQAVEVEVEVACTEEEQQETQHLVDHQHQLLDEAPHEEDHRPQSHPPQQQDPRPHREIMGQKLLLLHQGIRLALHHHQQIILLLLHQGTLLVLQLLQ